MKIETHLENLKESIQEVENSVKIGIVAKQRTIGFHTSAGAIDMLEIILHKNNLIDPGFVIKHEWFNSDKKIGEKFQFDFPNKKEIILLITKIEKTRNSLCYGKRADEPVLQTVIEAFNRLKEIFKKATNYEL